MNAETLKPNYEVLEQADRDGIYIEALSAYPYMMTVENAAEFLGQTSQGVTQFLRDGKLHGVKSGRLWRIPKTRFIEFLYENENASCDGTGEQDTKATD